MFTVTINNVEYQLPTVASEVPLKKYVPFSRNYNAYCRIIDQAETVTPQTTKEIIVKMAECIESYLGETSDIETIAGLPLGEFRESIMSLGRRELKSYDKTVSAIFDNLVRVVAMYKPRVIDGNYFFDYKGETYYISTIHRNDYKGSLTVAESIEILESQRIASQLKEKHGEDNAVFSQTLTILAVLARPIGETFPLYQEEIDNMIAERTVHFQDITMDVAIDVAFF